MIWNPQRRNMLVGVAQHSLIRTAHLLFSNPLTLPVIGSGGWGEQGLETESAKAKKKLEKRAESQPSAARSVGQPKVREQFASLNHLHSRYALALHRI
jgi:hypothetical protein